jgi:hypothetical protein
VQTPIAPFDDVERPVGSRSQRNLISQLRCSTLSAEIRHSLKYLNVEQGRRTLPPLSPFYQVWSGRCREQLYSTITQSARWRLGTEAGRVFIGVCGSSFLAKAFATDPYSYGGELRSERAGVSRSSVLPASDVPGVKRCVRLVHVAASCSVCGCSCDVAHLIGDKRARCLRCCPVCNLA